MWFVEGVAGIRVHFSEEYRLTIRAGVDAGDITDAQGKRAALHGIATSAWTVTARGFDHKVTVPGNGVAKVLIPTNNGAAGVNEGNQPVASAKGVPGVTVLGVETINKIQYLAMEVLAGSYHFTSAWTKPTAHVQLRQLE